MKPGKLCKKTGKRCYASHEEGARKGAEVFSGKMVNGFRVYLCAFYKCWHITTKDHREFPEQDQVAERMTR